MDSISHPLRAWREKNGISLRDMAKRLFDAHGAPLISHVSLGRIECGTQPPSIDVMRAVDAATEGCVRPEHMVEAYRPNGAEDRPEDKEAAHG